jgi:hypothetical protein
LVEREREHVGHWALSLLYMSYTSSTIL